MTATLAGFVANALMGLGLAAWTSGELLGIYRHTREHDTTTEWIVDLRHRIGRCALAAALTALYLVLLWHFETS